VLNIKNPFTRARNWFATTRTTEQTQWLEKEIAVAENQSLYQWGYGAYNPDDLVGTKGLTTYRDMRKDEQVTACQQTKILARLSTEWQIKAGDENNRQSVEMADFITDQLNSIKGTFNTKLKDIMTARDFGYSITEKIFRVCETGKWAGKIGIYDLKTKEPFDYRFKLDRYRNVKGIIKDGYSDDNLNDLGTAENPFPIHKFIIYSANKEFVNVYGQSDLRKVYKPWWSKNFIMKFMNIYLERFGQPTLMVRYPTAYNKDTQLMDILDNVLKNYQTKGGFRVPEGIELDLLEAKRKGEGGYRDAIELYDKKIARGLLCPDMAIQGGEKGGSFALSRNRFSTFVMLLNEMGYELEDVVMNDQVIKPVILLNYGEVDVELIPTFKFDSISEDDHEQRSKILDIMFKNGVVDKREDWLRDYINLPDKPDWLVKEEKEREEAEAKAAEERAKNPPETNPVQVPVGNIPHASGDGVQPNIATNTDDKEATTNILKKKFELTRQPNKFELKVEFAELEGIMNSYEEHMKEELTDVVTLWKDQIFKQAEKIFKTDNNKAVNDMWIRNVGDFKNVLKNWLIKIHLDMKFRDSGILNKAGVPIQTEKKPIPKKNAFALLVEFVNAPKFDPWSPMPQTQAIEFFNNKRLARIVDDNGKKKMLLLAKAKELTFYDDSAFAISGIESSYVLNQSKMIILNAIETGDTATAFKNLDNLFARYIDEGTISENLANPNRINTIIRTNTNSAANRGREALYNDPDVTAFVPFIQVSAILDGRTTDYCTGLDGKVFKKGDAPKFPAHHQCRTVTVPISTIEAEEEKPTISSLADEEAKLRSTGNQSAVRGVGFGGIPLAKKPK
jgi:SPP1 gp7 family putative phage head morphogenesis protein